MRLNGHYDNINDRDYFELEPNLSRLTSIIQLHRTTKGGRETKSIKVRLHKLGELLGIDENTELTNAYNESPNIVNITNVDNIL